jgi:two-component system OmpR family sensor kinase
VQVVADEEAVRRILGNLVRNALVHTPEGTTVRVETSRHDGWARVTVSDDGPGMSEDVAAHVFDRFYRPDTGRSRKIAGSGLGLAIVRSLAQSHGGTVALATRPGEGARFTVDLPLDGPPPQTTPQEATAFPKATGSHPDA